MTPAAVTTMAAAVQAAPVTTEEAVAPAALVAPTALAAPAVTVARTLLAAFGANQLATKTPVAPAQVPVLWALLAWVRRELEQTVSNASMAVPPGGTTVAAPPVDVVVTPTPNAEANPDTVPTPALPPGGTTVAAPPPSTWWSPLLQTPKPILILFRLPALPPGGTTVAAPPVDVVVTPLPPRRHPHPARLSAPSPT